MTVPTVVGVPSAVTVKALAGGPKPDPCLTASVNVRLTSEPSWFVAALLRDGGWVSEAMAPATFEGRPAKFPALIAETR